MFPLIDILCHLLFAFPKNIKEILEKIEILEKPVKDRATYF